MSLRRSPCVKPDSLSDHDITSAAGKLVIGVFATLAEFERELIAERTSAGMASTRTCGRKGGRLYKMGLCQVIQIKVSTAKKSNAGTLCSVHDGRTVRISVPVSILVIKRFC
ncbi:recombinase family protein [Scandinavium goeteborgense]|uniref:recombinase family protein n=1 Tax=Scandinavium goeteborgense TaxID=1851514 RepID=UPI00382722CD